MAQQQTERAFLATGDVARRLGVSDETVRNLVTRGVLPALRVGKLGARAIPVEAVDEYLARERAEGRR